MIKDEQRQSLLLDFATLSKLIVKDLNKNESTSKFYVKFTKDDVRRYLENPEKNESKLREISRFLYNNSSQYRRLIKYFSGMATLDYIIEPYRLDLDKISSKQFKSSYKKTTDFIDMINIKHEFRKVLTIAFKEDIFYGYVHSTKDSFYIQKLNPDYCQLSSIEDGVYNFSFDFSYFDKYKEKLQQYPSEFITKYTQFNKDKSKKWIELDSENTICIKVNEDFEFPLPPFSGVLEYLFDLDDYKSLKKAKEEIGNYAVLVQEIPMRKDSEVNNDFVIDFDTVMQFHNRAANSLPDQVGMITSPMPIKEIKFNKDKAGNDGVAEAERDFWSGSGVSQLLFNSDKGGSIGLTKSIVSDELIVFDVLKQIERWVNRKLKTLSNSTYKFRINMLELTHYNKQEFFDKVLKASQFGVPVKTMIAASLGLSPSSMVGMAYLENEILGLTDLFEPLSSTHTQSLKDEAGRPKKSGDLSDKGEQQRDNEANANRAK